MSDPDAKIKILIADDHEIVRVGLIQFLKLENLTVVGEACDGQEAIDKAAELAPDVILMDIAMPVVDGIEATRQIKERFPQIRVLLLTCHDSEQDVLASLASGADGYCVKDTDISQLVLAINAVNAGAAWLDSHIARVVLKSSASQLPVNVEVAGKDPNLSPREVEVLRLLVAGLANAEIAQRLHIANETVKTHMRNLMEKLAVSDRTQAAVKALREGLV